MVCICSSFGTLVYQEIFSRFNVYSHGFDSSRANIVETWPSISLLGSKVRSLTLITTTPSTVSAELQATQGRGVKTWQSMHMVTFSQPLSKRNSFLSWNTEIRITKSITLNMMVFWIATVSGTVMKNFGATGSGYRQIADHSTAR